MLLISRYIMYNYGKRWYKWIIRIKNILNVGVMDNFSRENDTLKDENIYLRNTVNELIKVTTVTTKDWQKTIKFIVIVMAITLFLTVTFSLSVLLQYYSHNVTTTTKN